MSEAFLGEIRVFPMVYAPKGWALCNGQFLPINQNQALFSLLGTMYGGNGQTTFALPNLQGRVPIHHGNAIQGQVGGETAHTITQSEMPQHTHTLQGNSADGTTQAPAGNLPARNVNQGYAAPAALVPLRAGSVTTVGGSQPHENKQPYLVLSFCIALQGIFPSRN